MPQINKTVLVSDTQHFNDDFAINAYMDSSVSIDTQKAAQEHQAIVDALKNAGVKIAHTPSPAGCQDGVYTANWGLCRGNKVIVSSLPNKRKNEEPYARKVLASFGKEIIEPPFPFSGQGDALPCGDLLFMGSKYRTDARVHKFVAQQLNYEVISLQTVPLLDDKNAPVNNAVTGWPDSFFYDIDLALAVITPNLIAWCPEAFLPKSQARIHALDLEKIEVSLKEATQGFACNLVSTGHTVVMSANAPLLASELKTRGFSVVTPEITELAKGGGYIRCTTLTLDN